MPYQQMASQQHHASIDALRGYYSTGPSPTNQSDDDDIDGDEDNLNDDTKRLLGKVGGGGGRKHQHNQSWQNLSEVELMTRTSHGHFTTTNGAANKSNSRNGLPPEGFALPDRKPLFKAPSATDPVKSTTSITSNSSTLVGGGNNSSKWKDKVSQSFKTAGPRIAGAANALVGGGGGGSSSRRQVVSSNSSKAWSDRKID